jgi:hypothetical protein
MNMLRLLSILLLILGSINKVHAQRHFRLNGVLPLKYENVDVILSFQNPDHKKEKLTATKGKFSFSGYIKEKYERVALFFERDGKLLGSWGFFIHPAVMEVRISDFETRSISFKNIPFLEEEKNYYNSLSSFKSRSTDLYNVVKLAERNPSDKQTLDSVLNAYGSAHSEYLKAKIKSIQKLSNTYLGLYLFNQDVLNNHRMGADSLFSIFYSFDKPVRETALGAQVEKSILSKQSLKIGQKMPDFTFITSEGKQIETSSFRQKQIVLLCFWYAGCRPCIKNIPFLKELSSQFGHKGLQLISISTDNQDSVWRKALSWHDMPWLQTCDLPDYVSGTRLRSLYSIVYAPQYFLLDREGKLVYHNFQSKDDDDYTKLKATIDELLR